MNAKSKKLHHPPALVAITHMLHECHTTETQRQKYGIDANINQTSENDVQRVSKYLKNINYYTHI